MSASTKKVEFYIAKKKIGGMRLCSKQTVVSTDIIVFIEVKMKKDPHLIIEQELNVPQMIAGGG
jgi:hypothetical protein